MSSYNPTAALSVEAAQDTDKFLRVKLDGTLAGVDEMDLGVSRARANSGEMVGLTAKNMPGTVKMLAADTIAKGDDVHCAGNGKVSAAGSVKRGEAMHAAVAGDVVEVLNVLV